MESCWERSHFICFPAFACSHQYRPTVNSLQTPISLDATGWYSGGHQVSFVLLSSAITRVCSSRAFSFHPRHAIIPSNGSAANHHALIEAKLKLVPLE